MAAPSPVTIESSPLYDAYQAPSITPDSLRRSVSTNSITRSSPQLLSPSTFVRPRAQPLKSGSRAQQVPAGAHAGFASAASIWKEQSNDNDIRVGHRADHEDSVRKDDVQGKGGPGPTTTSAGKLTKPRKAPKARKLSVTADTDCESPRLDKSIMGKKGTPTSLVKGPEDLHAKATELQEGAGVPRRPSLDISEYSFSADSASVQPIQPAKDNTAIRKPVRKRASKTTNNCEAPATKKTRKSKAKSEAIILDSDEPEEVLVEADAVDSTKITVVSAPVAKKPRSRKPKQSTVNELQGEDAAATAAQVKQNDQVPEEPTEDLTEKSAYFDQQPAVVPQECLPSSPPRVVSEGNSPAKTHVALDETTATESVANNSLPLTEAAPRRRRSWTPAKDSLSETHTLPVMQHGLDENMEQVPFSELLGNFSYLKSETVPVQRSASGEAITKRRRIELSEQSMIPQPQISDIPKAKAAPNPPKTVKKPKAVPKKPQTVTALALAAYQPPKDPEPVQSTVSTYFAPQKDVEMPPPTNPSANCQEVVAKVKKPRKSRAKVPPAEGEVVPAKKHTKAKTKTTKVKVKFDKNDHQAPLYSPTQACKQIKSQDFVFGTSSQLAADESPDFVRDMQLAIQQSEMTCALPNSSQIGTQLEPAPVDEEKSCARVPTAPHGTCLSVEQAGRELWCVSARDSTGSKLANEPSLPFPIAHSAADDEPIVRVIDIITLSSSGREGHDHQGTEPEKPLDPQYMPTSPNVQKALQASEDAELTSHTSHDIAEHNAQADIEPDKPPPGDDWVFLGSDDSVSLPQAPTSKPQERSHDLATSPVRRTALQPLDANISMTAPDLAKRASTKLQAHSFSTTAASPDKVTLQPTAINLDSSPVVAVSPKRGRGRPRKDSSLERPAQTSPARGRGRPRKNSLVDKTVRTSPVRGRGRPRKDTSVEKAGSVSPKRPVGRPRKESVTVRLASLSPKRPVGRPRKDDAVVQLISSSPTRDEGQPSAANVVGTVSSKFPKRPVGRPRQNAATTALSPRAFRRKTAPLHPPASQPTMRTEWTRIDEISDSDSPATPSPRRRRASSSPAFVRPLDFELPRSPSAAPKIAVSGNAAIKATDAGWPAIQTSMFPQIVETIKAAPISEDMNSPSWHEKILLYDPIVLEDLTAWLNAQGLRFEIERLKPKPKTKGRKKKDAAPEIDEWEVIRYELKPWMVQKWCEENSVCCLWREGLRGGVKARY